MAMLHAHRFSNRFKTLIEAFILALALLALGTTPTASVALAQTTTPASAAATAEAAKAAIDIGDAWTRASPGGRGTTAAIYLRITNAAKEPDALNGVEVENAQHAVVHTTTTSAGVARMNPQPSLPIPRASTVTLVPGGSHIMLEGLKAPLRQGESFIITLVFAKAGKISATVRVLGATATGPAAEKPAAPAPPARPGANPDDR
jgi:copper(I)-binding protein